MYCDESLLWRFVLDYNDIMDIISLYPIITIMSGHQKGGVTQTGVE